MKQKPEFTWSFERGFKYASAPHWAAFCEPRAQDYASAIFDAVPDLERIVICVFPCGYAVFRTPGFDMPQDVIEMIWNIKPAGYLFEYSSKIREGWE